MKKNSIYALMSAIALTGAVGFCGCSSSDDIIDNPDYDSEADVVKTQFAISLPENVNASNTRMTVDAVQQGAGSFRGMQDIVLIPFATKPTASTAKRAGSDITLASIDASTDLKDLSGNNKYKVYSNVSIPIGTSAFLFYAQAKRGSADANFADGFTQMIAPSSTTDPEVAKTAAYTFSPLPIYDGTLDNTYGNSIATYLSNIANAADATDATNTWSNAANGGLLGLYNKFTTNTAGSAAAVQRAVKDLWESVYALSASDNVAAGIVAKIADGIYATATGDALTFIQTAFGPTGKPYPRNLNLPDGAAAVKWNSTSKEFEVDNTGTVVGSLTSYVYPAALWYRANTKIKVSDSKQATDGIYTGKTTWDNAEGTGVFTLYNDGDGSVSPSTHSVILQDVIEYAVGRLDVTVKCAAGTLYDKNGDAVPVATGGFPVTAILIGGQKVVDFTFSNPTGSEYTIYDKDVTGVFAKDNESVGKNYTLALETEISTDVNIAVELTNNTEYDFIGKNGQLIPAGGTFYLTATLAASSAVTTDKRIFKQDFYTIANLTILQGYAKDNGSFPTGGNDVGLGSATNTIPDLRTPKLELGMAVDLSWQEGHKFDVEI